MLRAIIVDDEELSIKRLRHLLLESGKVELCGTFLNPLEACEFVKANTIDAAFLDISMPEISGMKLSGLLHEIDPAINVVFVTGYDNYAVQAFDMSALDYLLKPVNAERIAKTIGKIKKCKRNEVVKPALTALLFNGMKIYKRDKEIEPIKLRSPKTEELFTFLMYKGTVSRDEIIDTLWHGLEPEKAWKNLNSTLYYIRKAFNDNSLENCIVAGKNEISINTGSIFCDLYAFEQLLKQIRLNPDTNKNLLGEAISLYTGRFLNGKNYEWASDKTRELEQSYMGLLEKTARFHLGRNELPHSLHYFEEIVRRDVLREDIHYEVIRLYLELGRKNEALQQYRIMKEQLMQELGTNPDTRLKELIRKAMHE
ncbi:two-component SAPR family response regulator [Paenibacillus shirakamiensis]|uniref:Two-component SAPR family response regulator n=1 Tax=Paenibacillus shirakamiensis TaxID=1265935 RepID=A0ABS4JI81_9BACL|nr:BTAD domain-containing putative transcriptional regulator [Paenibacillus shirakamiensis]MBP2001397.1 two-component SAPR family response regulator [Paenibacillus shirakamiensis]